MLISWFVTGDALIGLQIGLAEVLTKMLLYYFHERIWFRINLKRESTVREKNLFLPTKKNN